MIHSNTLNDLMLEKVAYGFTDLKSNAKDIYRYGKNSLGLFAATATEPLSDVAQAYGRDKNNDILSRAPFIKDYTDTEIEFKNRRAVKNMDSIAKQHGYIYKGDNTWHNPTTSKTFRLDDVARGMSHTTFTGPHMMPKEVKPRIQKIETPLNKLLNKAFDKLDVPQIVRPDKLDLATYLGANDIDTIRIGKRGAFRNKGVLAHEFGHHLQGPKMRKLDTLARFTVSQTPRLAAINTAVGPFTYGIPATIAINKGLAATTAAAGATVAGSELQASYLGTKHLKNNLKHRSRAFVGVPSYIADTLVSPRTPLKQNSGLLKKLVKLK